MGAKPKAERTKAASAKASLVTGGAVDCTAPRMNERGERLIVEESINAFPQYDGQRLSGGGEFSLDSLMKIRASVEARLRALGVAEMDVEDVALECLYGVSRKIPYFNPGQGPFEAWVSGFVKNAARAWRAKAKRMASLNSSIAETTRLHDSDELTLGISEALSELEEHDRHLLTLRFSLAMNSHEIAGELGLTPVVVRKRISRAVEKLRTSESVQALLA